MEVVSVAQSMHEVLLTSLTSLATARSSTKALLAGYHSILSATATPPQDPLRIAGGIALAFR
jgi:hypothetical protein